MGPLALGTGFTFALFEGAKRLSDAVQKRSEPKQSAMSQPVRQSNTARDAMSAMLRAA